MIQGAPERTVDDVQRFWDERPCNIRHSPKPVGSREYFDEVEARKYFVEPHIRRLAEFERWRGKRVLEIGCGIGTDTMNFARNGAHVTAVDLSRESLAVARTRAQAYGLEDQVRFYHANAEELSATVPVEPYDLVYSFGVLHHTPHPERAVAQLRRYVRPGGTVKVMLYHRYAWKVLSILLTHGRGRFWRLEEIVAENSEAQTGCPVTFTYDRKSARRLLEDHDLRVVDLWVDHIFPYSIPEYVKYEYKRVWYFRYLPPRLFRELERRFGWHLCMTAVAPYLTRGPAPSAPRRSV
jgi:2-polyprenyl-3-methyl-5-hydroxy-6-metoxy-1,4-benzoquinol methylase